MPFNIWVRFGIMVRIGIRDSKNMNFTCNAGHGLFLYQNSWPASLPRPSPSSCGTLNMALVGECHDVDGQTYEPFRVARSACQKHRTLYLFTSSMQKPQIEGLDLYTYVYICIGFQLKFSTGQVTPNPDSPVQNQTSGNPRQTRY